MGIGFDLQVVGTGCAPVDPAVLIFGFAIRMGNCLGHASASLPCGLLALRSVLSPLATSVKSYIQVLGWMEMVFPQVFSNILKSYALLS